jgi:hypothetical protein
MDFDVALQYLKLAEGGGRDYTVTIDTGVIRVLFIRVNRLIRFIRVMRVIRVIRFVRVTVAFVSLTNAP